MLIEEHIHYLHISNMHSSTNHSEMSCCILHVCHFLLSFSIFVWLRLKHKRQKSFWHFSLSVWGNRSCANTQSWSSAHFVGRSRLFAFKGPAQNVVFLQNPLKVTTLTCYISISVGYFELKLHIHVLGIYFTYCESYNTNPFKIQFILKYLHNTRHTFPKKNHVASVSFQTSALYSLSFNKLKSLLTIFDFFIKV